MNKFLSPTFLVIALVLGFLWLKAHDAEVRATALAAFRADTIAIAQAERDSIARVFDYERNILMDSVAYLEGIASDLRRDLTAARRRSQTQTSRLDSLLQADTTVSDTIRTAVNEALEVLADEIELCTLSLANCDQQNGLLKLQLARDTVAITQARQAARTLAEEVQTLLREKSRRPWLTIGATLGYGATVSGGVVYAGPSVTAGIQLKFFALGGG